MKKVSSLMNRKEEVVFRELRNIAVDNNMHVFPKMRLSDVIDKGTGYLMPTEFSLYTKSHFDFVLADDRYQPIAVVEYDGPLHSDPIQDERDRIKNDLCRRSELGMLRINDRHVTCYRGMSVLRWIIEVSELQKAFDVAQQEGQISLDEPFDPCFIDSPNATGRFPYWLSAPSNEYMRRYLNSLDKGMSKGRLSLVGNCDGKSYRFSFIYFGDKVLFAQNAIREQGLDFPHYDLLDEINTCELGATLKRFKQGNEPSLCKAEVQRLLAKLVTDYNVHPSHSAGNGFPVPFSWDFGAGIKL